MPQTDDVKSPNQKPLWSRIDRRLGIVGVLIWLAWLLLQTGPGGFFYIGWILGVTAVLITCCTATRTITLRATMLMYLAGAFCMIVALFALRIINAMGIDYNHPLRPFLVPLIEETCMLAPVLGALWWMRKATVFLAITDFFLLALAAGAGYETVEFACIQVKTGLSTLPWMPLVLSAGNRITGEYMVSGQTIWLSIAGVGFGFASLLRQKKRLALGIAIAGVAWGVFDHMLVNYRVLHPRDLLVGGLTFLTLGGLTSPLLFYTALIAGIFVDLQTLKTNMPAPVKALIQKFSAPSKHKWTAVLAARSLAMGSHHYHTAAPEQKEEIGRLSLFVISVIVEELRRATKNA